MSVDKYTGGKDDGNPVYFSYLHDQPHSSKDFLDYPSCSKSEGSSQTEDISDTSKQQYIRVKSPSELYENNNEVSVYPSTSNILKRRLSPDVANILPGYVKGKRESRWAIMYKDMLQYSRELRILMHKVNVLCLIAYGNTINSIINDEFLMASMLSLVPVPLIPSGLIDIDYFLDLVEWFRCIFVISNIKLEDVLDYKNFETVFQTKRVICLRDYIMLFVSMLRALGFTAKYVMSFQPYPINVDDFEAESSTDEDEYLDSSDNYWVTLKKGRGYVKSNKGKDLLKPGMVELYKNPLPLTPLEKEKLIIKKYSTVLVSAIKRKRVKLDHWIEVFATKENRWMSVNIFHHTVDDIDSIYCHATLPLKYCLSWTNGNSVQEVTKLYAPDWYRGTSKRRADKQWVDSTFAIFDKRIPKKGKRYVRR